MSDKAVAFFKFGKKHDVLAPESAALTGSAATSVIKAELKEGSLWTYTDHEMAEYLRNNGKGMPASTQQIVGIAPVRANENNGRNEGVVGFTYWTQPL